MNDAEQTDIATTIRNAILIPANLNVSDDCLRILCNRRAQEAENSLILDTTAESPEKSPVSGRGCSQSSSGSEAISDQDLRCARELADLGGGNVAEMLERRVLRQVSPLPKGVIISGTPILNGENSGNAVFNRIGEVESGTVSSSTPVSKNDQLTFNGRIPVPPVSRPDHVVIQIEPDTSLSRISMDASAQPEVGGSVKTSEVVDKTVEEEVVTEEVEKQNKSEAIEESFEFTNERSPDLFADNDDDDEEEDYEELENADTVMSERMQVETERVAEEQVTTSAVDRLLQRDNHLLKRLQTAFSGVLPPPSVTNVAISLDVIVSKYKEYNGQLPEEKPRAVNDDDQELYLMKSVDSPTRAKTESWPELKNVICHDV